MRKSPTVTIIIVTYNHEAEITPCLASIWSSQGVDWVEVIVVDNASQDHTIQEIETFAESHAGDRFSLELIESAENSGFTRGTNLGLQASRGNFLFLLNPDTQIQCDTLAKMMTFLQLHPEAGLIAPQLRFPDGRIQPSCRRFPRRRDIIWQILGLSHLFPGSDLFNRWKMGTFTHTELAAVEQPQGAALMTSRSAFEQVGYLDTTFPMFFSDVDWCQRYFNHGFQIIFYPEAQVVHQKGSSIYRNREKMIWSSHQSFIHYFQKYDRGLVNSFLNLFIAAALLIAAGIRIFIVTILKFYKKNSPV